MDTASVAVPIIFIPPADGYYTVTKEANPASISVAGEVITYTITITNTGYVAVSNLGVTDPLVTDLQYVSGDVDGDNVLDVNESWVYSASYTVTQSDIDNNGIDETGAADDDNDIDNIVTITGENPSGNPTETDEGHEDVEIIYDTTVPSYIVSKTADLDFVDEVGEVITYTIIVENTSSFAISNVQVNDPLVTLTLISGDIDGDNLLDVDEIWVYEGTYTVTLEDFNGNGINAFGDVDGDGDIDNEVTVSGTAPNDDPTTDETDTEVVLLNQRSGIVMTKSAPATFCNQDSEIEYTIIVENTGNITLSNITILDDNADTNPNTIATLDPGQTETVIVIHTITTLDRANGQIFNSATVEATDVNNDVVTDISDDPNNSDDIDSDGDGDPDDITIVIQDADCDGVSDCDDLDDDNDGILDVVENGGIEPCEDLDDDGVFAYLDDNDNDASIGNDDGLPQNDLDGDNLPNHLDIDADGDGIPDNVEGQDTDDYIEPLGIDSDLNGLDDAYESTPGAGEGITPQDTDGDLMPDYLDLDSDNDNVPDNIEGHDHDGDGIADNIPTGTDEDNDGLDDGYEGSNIDDQDVNDEIDMPLVDLPDNDGDAGTDEGDVDYRDTDDDNDGIPTIDEDNDDDGNYENDDCDLDGIPDYLDEDPCFIDMPDGFSPNEDGNNDFYYIEGLVNLYPNFFLEIYDRYGNIVYDYKHNGSSSEPNWWKGYSTGRWTLKDNERVPAGTYFYLLYPNREGYKPSSGWLYVNR